MKILKKQQYKGFTLLETGVSLAIIAAIVAGGMAGQNVKHNLELKTIIDDVAVINQGVDQFRKRYNGIPGDLWNAAGQLKTATGNGNGNEVIDETPAEYLYFWRHMALSGTIDGDYDGTTNVPGTGVKAGPFADTGYYVKSDASRNIVIGFAKFKNLAGTAAIERSQNEDRVAALTPDDAWKIDKKFDDGVPGTGFIVGVLGQSASGTCISGGQYNVSNKGVACILEITVNKGLKESAQ